MTSKLGIGILCALTSLGSLGIYLFAFANEPLSVTSLFWAAPACCPLALLIYFRSKMGGVCAQAGLYILSVSGAYHVVQADCARGNCSKDARTTIVLGAMVAGYHMMGMLVILICMCIGERRVVSQV